MPEIHIHGHTRSCGATTVVAGQGDVYVVGQLVSVDGDPNSHGGGALSAGSNGVFINGKAVVNHSPDSAAADDLCPPLAGAHCSPATAEGEATVIVGDATDAVAIALGVDQFNRPEAEAVDILEGRAVEEANGVDPDTTEASEYGDGGAGAGNRYNNTSPVNNVSGAQPAPGSSDGTTDSPSPQPSNEDGEYIKWLPHVDSRVKPQVVSNLEAVSQAVGYQLQVTSGYRSPEYNASVGGAKSSQHMQGNATDIIQSGLTTQQRKDFLQAAIDAGFTGIGIYNTFTHVDIRGSKVAWGSNGSRSSLPNYPWAVEVLQANGYSV